MRTFNRRALLSTAAVGAASLSGCSGIFEQTEGTDQEAGTETPAPDLNTELTVQAVAVAREGDTRGRVTVSALVENPTDRRVAFSPEVRLGDTDVTGFQAVSDRGGSDEMRVAPSRQRRFRATEIVPADDYVVTHNGKEVTTVELRPHDTPYAQATPGRTGAVLPSGGIGYEPELVTQFPLQTPDGLDRTDGGRARVQAVTDDRLYVRIRWDTPDGERYSNVALDRWTGEEHWHRLLAAPSEVAVVGETEYVFDGGTLRARTLDGTVRWENDIAPFEYESQIDETTTYMVPTDKALFVGTDEGVKEVNPASGEVRRTLPAPFAAVGEDGLFTYGGQVPVAKFPLDGGTEPEWIARPSTETGTGDTGAVADGTVIVSSPVGYENPEDARSELFAYDAATGEEQWSVVASRAIQVGGFTALPGVGDLNVAGGAVFFRSNRGLKFVDIASGELTEVDHPDGHGAGEVVAPSGPRLTYGYGDNGTFDIASAAGLPVWPDRDGDDFQPFRSLSISAESGLNVRDGPALYGRGVLYFVANGYVYGYSGAEEQQL